MRLLLRVCGKDILYLNLLTVKPLDMAGAGIVWKDFGGDVCVTQKGSARDRILLKSL